MAQFISVPFACIFLQSFSVFLFPIKRQIQVNKQLLVMLYLLCICNVRQKSCLSQTEIALR